MTVKLLTEHHLEFLRLKRGCTGSSESTHVKMPQCWKSHVMAHIIFEMMDEKVITILRSKFAHLDQVCLLLLSFSILNEESSKTDSYSASPLLAY